MIEINDIHSQINPTQVLRVEKPSDIEEVLAILKEAVQKKITVSISGGQHSMGGQQFAENSIHINTSNLNKILHYDDEKGLLSVEAGIMWPKIIEFLQDKNRTDRKKWAIHQKQTGGDNFSIGGSLSSNIHGRNLKTKPFIQDIDSFKIITADTAIITCSRNENSELFRLAIGGYGLFGIVIEVTIRLVPWTLLERVVELNTMDKLIDSFNERVKDGFLYGDFQFNTDDSSDKYLSQGIFPCYRPVAGNEIPDYAKYLQLTHDQWKDLYILGHINKPKVTQMYISYYLASNGNIYDTNYHQINYYPEQYHKDVDAALQLPVASSEMITEIYIPREVLGRYMAQIRKYFLKEKVMFFFGTVRLIQKDDESFLAWAKESYACVVFNIHFEHSNKGIDHVRTTFQYMIDKAIEFGGSFYLTYHKWARKDQIISCYPQMVKFLELKRKYDPEELFRSSWYEHYKHMFNLT